MTIESRRNVQGLVALAFILVAVLVASCDVDLFGSTWKQLGGGYRLVQSEIPHCCAVIAAGERGGPLACEIGWEKPFILFRQSTTETWTVINTETREQTSILEAERRANEVYSRIPVHDADNAWRRLSRRKPQW